MRQEEYGENAKEYGDASFDEKDEWPSFVVASVDFGETCSEKSTKCTRPEPISSALRVCNKFLVLDTYNGAAQ